jgi:hypothetical protein
MIFALRPLKRNAKVQGTQAGLYAVILRDISESEIVVPQKVTFVQWLKKLVRRPNQLMTFGPLHGVSAEGLPAAAVWCCIPLYG